MSDELARWLVARAGEQPEPLRALGAYVTAWDPLTGANTVSVGAAHYTGLSAIRGNVLGTGPCLILFTPEPVIIGSVRPPDA